VLEGRLVLGTEILTSGTLEARCGARGGGSGVASLSLDTGRGGAGTTPVIPSGPSETFCAACLRRSPAPPGRGLKAEAALAALQNVPAISPLDFLDLIIGPNPGRSSSSGSAGTGGVASFSSLGAGDSLASGVGTGSGCVGPISFLAVTGVTTPGDSTIIGSARGGSGADGASKSITVAAEGKGIVGRLTDSLRGDSLSALRGGGATGSRLFAPPIKGGGTRSLSNGRVGSIGGRLLSGGTWSSLALLGGRANAGVCSSRARLPGRRDGGGGSSLARLPGRRAEGTWSSLVLLEARPGGSPCSSLVLLVDRPYEGDWPAGGGGNGCVGGSGASPKRPKEPGPGMPFLERGGMLDASSLFPVIYELPPTES
jgi:hypothetical protein